MNAKILREEILRLKKQKNTVILAHNYQIPQIQELADYLGDSLELAKISKNLRTERVVFCGVRFMAETAKILSPHKRVFQPVLDAGCPLADMINPAQVLELKAKHPTAKVVSYVNSSAEVKALSDVCCTSSNAVSIVKNIPGQKVIFIPDKNLGWWVKKNVPRKEIIIWNGYCQAHEEFSLKDLKTLRKLYPDAKVLVHPECRKEILENADDVVSTAGMIEVAKKSSARVFIIGTEEGMIYRLKKECPDKEFFSLGGVKTCRDMKKITLVNLYECLEKEIYEINLDAEIIRKAKMAIERMIEYT